MSANEDTASITSSKSGDLIENDLSNGILQILKPAVEEVDNRVLDVRYEFAVESSFQPNKHFCVEEN